VPEAYQKERDGVALPVREGLDGEGVTMWGGDGVVLGGLTVPWELVLAEGLEVGVGDPREVMEGALGAEVIEPHK